MGEHDEFESTISYILVNGFVSVSIMLISIFEIDSYCTG